MSFSVQPFWRNKTIMIMRNDNRPFSEYEIIQVILFVLHIFPNLFQKYYSYITLSIPPYPQTNVRQCDWHLVLHRPHASLCAVQQQRQSVRGARWPLQAPPSDHPLLSEVGESPGAVAHAVLYPEAAQYSADSRNNTCT